MSRPRSLFEVDLGAVAINVRSIRTVAGRAVWICAALKGNAYGFGLVPVARAVKQAGVDAIGAGSIDDGIELRESGVRGPILVYGGDLLGEAAVRLLEANHLIATVHDAHSLRACVRYATSSLDVMLEVDVGLSRLGFEPPDARAAIHKLEESAELRLRGVYTHMRVPEKGPRVALRRQLATFDSIASARPTLIAMAVSSRVLDLLPSIRPNAVDVGRAVYGLLPRRGGHLGPRLRPVFGRLSSTLIAVRSQPGAISRLGVVPFGRAAGMAAIAAPYVLVRGRRAPVVGAPALEHTRIDLSRIARAQVGDEVVIVGRQNRAVISARDVLKAHPELPDTGLALAVGPSVRRAFWGQGTSRSRSGAYC